MGRREGERYERHVIRRAPFLFNGGEGGSPYEPMIQQRLASMLPREQREQLFHDEEGDPFLADLIWWKDGQVAVVEISLQVDGYDVIRASRRAQTLRNASIQAIGVVIGRDWANPDAYDAAIRYRVEWLIRFGNVGRATKVQGSVRRNAEDCEDNRTRDNETTGQWDHGTG
jgi:hypothetical protein